MNTTVEMLGQTLETTTGSATQEPATELGTIGGEGSVLGDNLNASVLSKGMPEVPSNYSTALYRCQEPRCKAIERIPTEFPVAVRW